MQTALTFLCAGALAAAALPLRAQPAPAQLVAAYARAHGLTPGAPPPAVTLHGTSDRGWRRMTFRRWYGSNGQYRGEVDMGGSSVYTVAIGSAKPWEINPYSPMEGPAAIPAAQLPVLADEAAYWPALLTAPAAKLALVRTERNAAATHYHLQLQRDSLPATFVLDSASGRLVESSIWLRSPTGRAVQVSLLTGDYRNVQQLRLPHRFEYRFNGQTVRRDSVHAYTLQEPTTAQLAWPAVPIRPKTFGFRPDHPAERWLLSETLPAPVQAPPLPPPDGTRLQPVSIRYAGVHKGLHPDWVYETSWVLTRDTVSGQAVWRLGQEVRSAARDEVSGTWIDYRSLRPVQDVVGYQVGEITYRVAADSVHMSLRRRQGNTPQVADAPDEVRTLPYRNGMLTMNTVDAVLAALPLRPGFQTAYTLLYEFRPRPFVAKVSGAETVDVGGQAVPAYVVELLPQDGDRHAHAVLYLRRQAPHVPLRRRYVVHPQTLDANTPKSMGNEDATALLPGA